MGGGGDRMPFETLHSKDIKMPHVYHISSQTGGTHYKKRFQTLQTLLYTQNSHFGHLPLYASSFCPCPSFPPPPSSSSRAPLPLSLPLPLPGPLPLSLSLSLSLPLSLSPSLCPSVPLPLSPSVPLSLSPSLCPCLSVSLSLSLSLSLSEALTLTFTFTFTFTLTLTLTRPRTRPPFAPLSPCAPSLCPSPCVPLSLTKRTQMKTVLLLRGCQVRSHL